jgi:hypothetical protein
MQCMCAIAPFLYTIREIQSKPSLHQLVPELADQSRGLVLGPDLGLDLCNVGDEVHLGSANEARLVDELGADDEKREHHERH